MSIQWTKVLERAGQLMAEKPHLTSEQRYQIALFEASSQEATLNNIQEVLDLGEKQ